MYPCIKCILKIKANASHLPFSFSYAERNSGNKFANTEKSVQALFRLGITNIFLKITAAVTRNPVDAVKWE